MRKPTLNGVENAAKAVAKVLRPTPLLEIDIDGARVFAKAESLQPVGAFKIRGAWWRLSNLTDDERQRGVVAFSSGNHAQGVAWAARRLGISATIVMPSNAPAAKIANTRALGADVVLYDREREDRAAIADQIAARTGAVTVPPFEDPYVIEGQGSIAIEAVVQMDGQPDLIVTCCGGGGLASGLALACPAAEIVVVEPEGWDDMGESLRFGKIVEVPDDAPPTTCDALQTKRPGNLTFELLRERHAKGVAVSEADVENAMRFAFGTLQLVLEPGGAVALAAVLSGKVAPVGRTLVILSGGNVDPAHFAGVLTR